jgi:hypothetical protein
MKTVAVYHSSVPNAKSQEKIDILRNFSAGAKTVGENVLDVYDTTLRTADVGIIQGWLGPGTPSSTHLQLRNNVINHQLQQQRYVVAVDSNLFLYADTSNPMHYLRYSFNGVFPSTGIYCDTEIDPTRWQKISRNLNLNLKNYRTNGDHILICLQRNGGWSMGNTDVQDWAIQTIDTLRQHTDRPFIIRAHPGDKASREYLDTRNPKCKIKFSKRVRLSTEVNLVNDLKGCWAAVNYNSSPVVGAAMEGYPIFVMDTAKSQCAEIANTDLSQIENPRMPDRQKWVERLSMFHWNFDELKSGECWTHMRKFTR